MNLIPKLGMILLWLACAANVVAPFPSPFGSILMWTAIGLLGAHTIECVVFSSRVAKAGGSKLGHYIQLLLLGVLHAQTLPK
jgi:uncharacterized protein YhhL (DUF1145 family)